MKIACLTSGGVDSSVALALLKKQGQNVTAFYLKIWLEDEMNFLGQCPWEEDLSFVKSICKTLDVPLEIISLQKEYWNTVVAYTIEQCKAGKTPNPDILCNEQIKFKAFYEKIPADFEKIASGHYARLEERDGKQVLKTCADTWKDQTYFLAQLSQTQLAKALFPLGGLTKPEVRALATSWNLAPAARKDSYGICFLGKFSFHDFIKHHLGTKKGVFIEYETGVVVGNHDGYWFYTIGQRRGIGLSGGPWYVVKKEIETNIVFISKQYYSAEKERRSFLVTSLHWINGAPTSEYIKVKLRHGPHFQLCKLTLTSITEGIAVLTENDQGIAPGQFAVFYDNDECLGVGTIS